MKYKLTYWDVEHCITKETPFRTKKEVREFVKKVKSIGRYHTFKLWQFVEES